MTVSKKTRFEVLKRDGFKCVYCGATPTGSALQVDHVVPQSKGGNDDPSNLVTACEPCNNGKRARPLEDRTLKSNVATEADEEHIEQIRSYLKLQKKIVKARDHVAGVLVDEWKNRIGCDPLPSVVVRFPAIIDEFGFDKIVEAISIVASKGSRWSGYACQENQAKYFHGILRNWREQGVR